MNLLAVVPLDSESSFEVRYGCYRSPFSSSHLGLGCVAEAGWGASPSRLAFRQKTQPEHPAVRGSHSRAAADLSVYDIW